MRGVPLRIEIGPRDLKEGKIVFKRRNGAKEFLEYQENAVVEKVKGELKLITLNLKAQAWKNLQDNIREVSTIEEAKATIETKGGIVSFWWCGDEACGKDLEELVHVDILGAQEEALDGICIKCGQPIKYRALLARTY